MNETYTVCVECRKVPKLTPVTLRGKLYCSMPCYLESCKREYSRAYDEAHKNKDKLRIIEPDEIRKVGGA